MTKQVAQTKSLWHVQLKQFWKQLKGVQWLHLTGKKQSIVDELCYAALNLISQALNDFSKRKPQEFLDKPALSTWTTAAGISINQTHRGPKLKQHSDVQRE